ncbi:MAG: class I SAM-dependent methyltransferase [Planctomycetota bacterium]
MTARGKTAPAASGKSKAMQAQYAAWPYPKIPLLAKLPSTHPWELHVAWLWDRAGSGPAPAKPRIWIAGCGTFQPYAFAVANPKADITATDLSEPSLRIARRRCALHRQKHVRFAPVDLADTSTWPDGRFDLIECYGVLMNLPDPQATLRALRERLTDRGVLRLMVYPHYSRQRIFQLQRVASLLGFHADDPSHPANFRRFVRAMPQRHPLRYAFTSYADSRNDAGVVDGFLHKGDRGFSAFQLSELLQGAELEPAFWFHRPWARPDVMAERLSLQDRSQSFVLNYLDLWQELRTNFIVVAKRSCAPTRIVQPKRPHPMFVGTGSGGESTSLRHLARLTRLRVLGGKLPSRTEEPRVVLRAGIAPEHAATALGGDHGSSLAAHSAFAGEAASLRADAAIALGPRAPNPLYAHLFAAFEFAERHPELALGDLETQMGRWLPWADALEHHPISWGLTPYASYQKLRTNIRQHLEDGGWQRERVACYEHVRVRGDELVLARVRHELQAHAATVPRPIDGIDDASLRELFVLLHASDRLFLTFERA